MNEVKVTGSLSLDGLRNISKLIKEGKKLEAVNLLTKCQNDILFFCYVKRYSKRNLGRVRRLNQMPPFGAVYF